MPFLARSLTGRCDILAVENDFPFGDGIVGVAGDGIAQRGLAGAVGAHEHVGLVPAQRQIDAVQNFGFILGAHMQIFNFQ